MSKRVNYVLIIRLQSTMTSVYFMDNKHQILGWAAEPISIIDSNRNWKSYDPLAITYSVQAAINRVVQSVDLDPKKLKGVGVVTEAYAYMAWNPKTGRPYGNAVSSLCSRTKGVWFTNNHDIFKSHLRDSCGQSYRQNLPVLTYQWIHSEYLSEDTHKGSYYGGVDSWLLYHLTGRQAFVTDYTHAQDTGGFNLRDKQWDEFSLSTLGLVSVSFPQVGPSQRVLGYTKGFVPLLDNVPIVSMVNERYLFTAKTGRDHFGDCFLQQKSNQVSFFISQGVQYPEEQKVSTLNIRLRPSDGSEYGVYFQEALPEWPQFFGEKPHALTNDVFEISQVVMTPFVENGVRFPPKQTVVLSGLNEDTSLQSVYCGYLQSRVFKTKQLLNRLEGQNINYNKTCFISMSDYLSDSVIQFQSNMLQISHNIIAEKQQWLLLITELTGGAVSLFGKKSIVDKLHKQFIPTVDPISCFALYQQWCQQKRLGEHPVHS